MLADLALDDWNTMVDVGLTGTFLLTQAAGRWMIANGAPGLDRHRVVGRWPAALWRLGRLLDGQDRGASCWRATSRSSGRSRGIRVNAVCPGHVETPLTAYLKDPEIKAKRSALTPLGRVGQPDDVAGTVAFLFSDDADYITAAAIDVDGGLGSTVMNHMPGRTWS